MRSVGLPFPFIEERLGVELLNDLPLVSELASDRPSFFFLPSYKTGNILSTFF